MNDYLECPECGDEVTALPAHPPDEEWDTPHWQDGDAATCACGARVRVEADGERAWLESVETDE